jgi:hypothetical protein
VATTQTVVGKVELNHRTLAAILNGDLGMDKVLHDEAGKVLARAQAIAPVSSGKYKAELGIEETHTDRLVVRVVARAPYSRLVEYRHGVLTRALAASSGKRGKVGLKKVPTS